MTTPADVVIKKLRRAEDEALEVLKAFDFPLELDDLWLSEDSKFKDASDRDRQRISAAVNVLISVREVHRHLERGDCIGALRFLTYVEQGPNLLDYAFRGAKTIRSASAGGQATAAKKRPERDTRHARWRQRARELWNDHSDWSAVNIAKQLEKEGLGKLGTIRKKIGDLKPARK